MQTLLAGVLLVIPLYLTILLMLKAMKSLEAVVRPVAQLLPGSKAVEDIMSFAGVLLVCLLVGMALRTAVGQDIRTRIESSLLQKIPGYDVIRNMTVQLTGQSHDRAWQPALAEIEEALVPAFIVEEFADGRFTVFVPSVPTPLAGSIYILSPERVHPLNVPFTEALRAVTRWGAGSKELVAAMERRQSPSGAIVERDYRCPVH
jgi:uncharacterized membrane protein